MGQIVPSQAEINDRLIFAIDNAREVRNEPGFFLWSQGALKSVINHEILICAIDNGPGRNSHFRWFSSSRYFKDEHFVRACEPNEGVIACMMDRWQVDSRPRFLVDGQIDEATRNTLAELELKNLVGHGVHGAEKRSLGYFCFGRTTMPAGEESARTLDLILPTIYTTFCRVLAEEARRGAPIRIGTPSVTPREVEILHWIKEGKTTTDIAEHLGLSPFTVRNHVKNIFKKLGARSRSHAVAQAISMGILRHRSAR